MVRQDQCPLLRPSRPGEAQMATDFVGRAVQSWFRQVRRIQSLLHAVRAGKETGDAQIYRANLWHSICMAKGFGKSFKAWWPDRPLRLQGSPVALSAHVPPCWMVELIWEDFQCNYRKFESWHVRRRKELLTVQMEENHNRLFAQVKPPNKQALTHLQESSTALIIGVSEDGLQIQLDQELPSSEDIQFQIEDRPATLTFETADVATIEFDGCCVPGAEVTATQHFSTFQTMDQELRRFWSRRWMTQTPSATDWERILAFAHAYLPHLPSQSMPLDVESWTEINKRYTPRLAKGPDGVSRLDLQYMPRPYKESLVEILQRSELEAQWPDSLLTGLVHPLPKRPDSKTSSDFRPVIIYSMVYRSWSSHRARRLLRQLQRGTGSRQFGFMPETDSAEMWMIIQAMVESACHQEVPLHGYVTDIQKAFENLPRNPIFQIATQLGAPSSILALWSSFLNNMSRRFVIAGQVGEPLFSNHGFPEGCGLSCYAMSIVDISFHFYYRIYCQRTMELSYVDNLELMAFDEGALQQGIICLQSWLDLWSLELDRKKSYIWSTTPTSRKTLALLGWKVSLTEKDLGAPMAYGKKKATSILMDRMDTLTTLWPMLTRALAPQWQKERILRCALWPRAFYGSSICAISKAQLKQLRADAMRALGYRRAGAAPHARLFLLCHEQCDPGYYYAWNVLLTFRRVARKRPMLQDLWTDYMVSYAGLPSYGPFATLLDIFMQVGWTVSPPFVLTHDNVQLDWLHISTGLLQDHFLDAWTQQLAVQLSQRKDIGKLNGLDRLVLLKGHSKIPPHQQNLLKCLQDGTFVTTSHHAKFDLTVSGNCKLCGEPDTIEHRCTQCRHLQHIYAHHLPILNQWSRLPVPHRQHLLPDRNPWVSPFRTALTLPYPYQTPCKLPWIPQDQIHLFVDGSCLRPDLPEFALASWAVVSATHDLTVIEGVVSDGRQSSDRAELLGLIRAVEIAQGWDKDVTIWTDSAFAGGGLARLLQDPDDIPDLNDAYESEWLRLRDAVTSFPRCLRVQHVPGHGKVQAQYMDVSEWASYWNHRADRAAAQAFQLHPAELRRIWHQLLAHHERQVLLQQQLQNLHWAVAQEYHTATPAATHGEDDQDTEEDATLVVQASLQQRRAPSETFWLDGLAEDWLSTSAFLLLANRYSMRFTRMAISFLVESCEAIDAEIVHLSWLELATIFYRKFARDLPIPSSQTKNEWVDSGTLQTAGQCSQCTVALILRLARTFVADLAKQFGLVFPKVQGLNLAAWGIYPPQFGLPMRFPPGVVLGASLALHNLVSHRPIRTVNDLARPFT